MDVLEAQDWKRPVPAPDGGERPFYEAAARGELLIQCCPACDHRQFYPRAVCTACGATPEWMAASGRGTVHTFTVIRQQYAPGFRDDVPYVVAMIALPEGVQMMGGVTGCPVDAVRVGMAVEAYALLVEEGLALPFWRPVEEPG